MKNFFTHADPVVPMHHPRVLFETAVAHGAPREALLENVGVSEATLASPDALMSYVQFAMLTSNALRLTGEPGLGIAFGKNLHPPQMGMLGLALLSSPTAFQALEVGLKHYRLLAPAWDLALEMRGGRALLSAREAIPLQPFRVFATEALLAAIDTQTRLLLGKRAGIFALQLHFPRPEHADRFPDFYDLVPTTYDADFTEVEFDAAILNEPIDGADPATARLAERLCASEAARTPSREGLVEQVRKLLDGAQGRPPSAEEAARRLRTSARSLRRALARMGTSYQELSDQVLGTRARALVADTSLTAQQVAETLGFSDLSSFRRAFRRWTGSTPNSFRGRASRP